MKASAITAEADWMIVLRRAVAESSQAQVAGRLGYSPPVLSQVLSGSYRGALGRVEQAVRGALMEGMVACPALGSVEAHLCLDHQKRARMKQLTNPFRVRMTKACRACVRFSPQGKGETK